MADPRKVTDYSEIGFRAETFAIDASTITYDATKAGGADTTMIGKAVTLSTDRTVALCADGDAVIGKLILVEPDGMATVQTKGYATFGAGTGATLTLGAGIVGALLSSAKGYIRSAASGTAAETVKEVGKIIDNDTTTAVVVDLG